MIFLDNASTTPCCEPALAELKRYGSEFYGNPSSSHSLGRASKKGIEEAREFFATHFGVEPEQIIFTGSGTEADNLAVLGCALSSRSEGQNVACSAIEHPAVLGAVQSLKHFNLSTAILQASLSGKIVLPATPSTLTFVSIHAVNNVVGTVFDVEEIARQVKAAAPQCVFHSDAVQSFGKITTPRKNSGVDLLSLSAHKIEGPKGVGALIILNHKLLKNGLRPLIWGGNQEGGFRSGTQNPGLIAAFHQAAKLALAHREHFLSHTRALREQLLGRLTTEAWAKNITVNSPSTGVPYILHFSIPPNPAGATARLLEEAGFLVSTGSACGSGKTEPDPVLKALELPRALQTSGIRVSFGLRNTIEEINSFVDALKMTVERLSRLSP